MQTIRDHGVRTEFQQPLTVEQMKLRLSQLTAEKAELDHRLSPLFDKIQSGTATPAEMQSVVDLSDKSCALATRLQSTQAELTVAEQRQTQAIAATRRKRFDQLIVESRRKRSEFARVYREACILLGSLCANVDEATQIANEFAAANIAGMMPQDRNAITELSERIDPLPALLDSGLSPTETFGWNLQIPVIPLKGKMK